MDSMPFAFSVHNFISSVGADAGFAAIIGLAVLILLYFAHARETANLREEASILAERLQQAEARVAQLSQPQSVTAAVPAAEGVHVTDQRAATGSGPFAPAGVGAPALAAATRVVPLPEPPPSTSVQAPAARPAVAMAAATAASSAAPSARTVSPSTTAPPVAGPPSVPRPATAAGAGAGGSNGGGRAAAAPAAAPVGQPRGPAQSLRQLPPLSAPSRRRGGVGRRVAVGLIALVLVGAAVVALVILTSGSTTNHSTPPVPTTNAPVANHPAVFTPASVTVAVLNGTSTNQLAHRVAAKLASSGYKEGKVATASNQTQTATIVAYFPGAKNRADALHVATALNLKPASVQPIDQTTQQVACPPPSACQANVVVTVGADLSTL